MSSASRAQTIETSHQVELPIHFFSPLRIQVSPSRFAVVRSPPDAPEPTSGSVRAKQPILSNRAIGGSHFSFCSSDPSIYIEPIASPLCTPTKVENDGSIRAISIWMKPNNARLPPAQPYPFMDAPPMPSFFTSGSRSNGN